MNVYLPNTCSVSYSFFHALLCPAFLCYLPYCNLSVNEYPVTLMEDVYFRNLPGLLEIY